MLPVVLACSHHQTVVEPAEPEVPEIPCPDLPPPPPIQTGYDYLPEYPELVSVRYNPLDANEAAVVAHDLLQPGNYVVKGLYRLDLRTGQRTLLARYTGDNFDWGRNGWILFTGNDGQIWKIRPTGDSLTSLNVSGGDPVWSRDGSRIAYLRFTTNYQLSGLFIMSAQGQQLQFIQDARIRAASGGYAFAADNNTLAILSDLNQPAGTAAFGLYDLTARTFRPLQSVPHGRLPSGISWTADYSRLIWSDGTVTEVDPATGQARALRSRCVDARAWTNRWHIYPSLSPDEQRLLMITGYRYVDANGGTHTASRLQTTDRNGQHIRDVPFQ